MFKGVDFEGKCVAVTGAGKGIGRCLVDKLINNNAKVVAISRTQRDLEEITKTYGNEKCHTVCLDLATGQDSISKALEPVLSKYEVDYLVNNAAINNCPGELTQISEDKMLPMFEVNLFAQIYVTQVWVNCLKRRNSTSSMKHASVVNISSQTSKSPLDQRGIYGITKAGLDHLTRQQAKELGSLGIRVNSIHPTVVITDMTREFWSDPVRKAKLTNRMPLARFAEMEEVINPIIFFLSESASMITGSHVCVDGGYVNCF